MRWAGLAADAAEALLLHRLRSALSALGIVLAVAAVVSMLAVAEGARRVTLEQIGRLGARNIVVRGLPLSEEQRADARTRHSRGLAAGDAAALVVGIPALTAAAPLRELAAAVRAARPEDHLAALAVTGDLAAVIDLPLREGRFILPIDVEERRQVCVLGAQAALLLGADGRPGGEVRLEERLYRVVGVLRERRTAEGVAATVAGRDYNRCLFLPLGAEPEAPAASGDDPEALTEITVQVRPGVDVEAAAAAVRLLLAQAHGGVGDHQVIVPVELVRQAQRTQRVFNWVLGCIAGISLLVGGIGITNIMLASVAERTREVGLRRAVGASRAAVVAQFLAEAVLLAAAGGAAGAALGVGAAALVSRLAGWSTAVTGWALALAVGVAVCVGVLAGLYPALAASRLDPIAALRHE